MAAKEFTPSDAQSANISIVETGRGTQAVHDVVVAMRANRRQGNASTKSRGEVAATGKKPFKQKGTGRARQGGNASPHHRGGGVAHGPKPRDFSKSVNRKTKRLAFRKALGFRISEGAILRFSSFAVEDGLTKSFLSTVSGLGVADARRVLIIGGEFSEMTYRSGRNVQNIQLVNASDVNTEQILHFTKVVILDDAIETLAQRTA